MRLHMEANELFACVGDVGGAGYALEPREPQRVRAGRLRGGAAARSRRLRGVLRGQPPLGHDRRALPHRLRRAGARRRRRGAASASARRSSGRTPRRRSRSSCSRSAAIGACSREDRRARAGGDDPHLRTRPRAAATVVRLRGAPGARRARGGATSRAARRRPGRRGRGKPRRPRHAGPRAGRVAPVLQAGSRGSYLTDRLVHNGGALLNPRLQVELPRLVRFLEHMRDGVEDGTLAPAKVTVGRAWGRVAARFFSGQGRPRGRRGVARWANPVLFSE